MCAPGWSGWNVVPIGGPGMTNGTRELLVTPALEYSWWIHVSMVCNTDVSILLFILLSILLFIFHHNRIRNDDRRWSHFNRVEVLAIRSLKGLKACRNSQIILPRRILYRSLVHAISSVVGVIIFLTFTCAKDWGALLENSFFGTQSNMQLYFGCLIASCEL